MQLATIATADLSGGSEVKPGGAKKALLAM